MEVNYQNWMNEVTKRIPAKEEILSEIKAHNKTVHQEITRARKLVATTLQQAAEFISP